MFGVMMNAPRTSQRPRCGSSRPALEGLEDRLLLYSTLGGQWTYGSRISYSFAPDGTNVAGTPSALFQAMTDRGFSTSEWQEEFHRAAAAWQAVTNINFVNVPDSGDAFGVSGNQQNDPRFGDVRIFGHNMPGGQLAEAHLPPPFNGGTDAGDLSFNTSTLWRIGSDYDLRTVALHELGHALGLDHTQPNKSYAVMYESYNGVKPTLSSDDIAGIRSIYGVRRQDWLDAWHNNKDPWNAINISGYLDSSGRLALPQLDVTSNNDQDWFYVQAPSNASGTMTVTMQSSDLSLLSPRFEVYNSALQLAGWTVAPNAGSTFGATVSLTFAGVTPGTGVYINALGWNSYYSGDNGIGMYGLQVDFSGGPPMAPFPPLNTTVAEQPDQGGGTINQSESFHVAPEGLTFHGLAAPDPVPGMMAFQGTAAAVPWLDADSTEPSYGVVQFPRVDTDDIGRFGRGFWSAPGLFGLMSAMTPHPSVVDSALLALAPPDASQPPDGEPDAPRRPFWVDDLLTEMLDT